MVHVGEVNFFRTACENAAAHGFVITEGVLASDGHCTGDSGALTQSEIIAHHNNTLDGFDAGPCAVSVVLTAEISFRS